jgi:pimeloyl-ACP methyl ester carboxylesterase
VRGWLDAGILKIRGVACQYARSRSPRYLEGLFMSFQPKHKLADVARAIRKTILARGWRRYATSGFVAVLAVFGTVAAVNAQAAPAHSMHGKIPSRAMPASPALAGFQQGFVAISDSTIHYVIGGHGPVLVLLHGWPMTWWEWHTAMPGLAKDHTVVAFDLPGLGDSTVPASGGYTAVDTAQRLHEAVTALGFGRISILSHDLGVNIAYAYAELYRDSVARMAVLDSLLNGFGLESIYGFSFHFKLNMAASPTPEGIINNHQAERAYLNYMYSLAANPAAITNQDRRIWYAAYASPANREAGYNYYRAFPANQTYNLAHATPKLTMPVLAMGGEDSFGAAVATSFDNVATDVRTVVAPGSGHYIPEEDPGFLAECASLFFGSDEHPHAPAGFAACLP